MDGRRDHFYGPSLDGGASRTDRRAGNRKYAGNQAAAGVARREVAEYHTYDYLVVNDRVEDAAAAIAAIVTAEKCKVSRGACPSF